MSRLGYFVFRLRLQDGKPEFFSQFRNAFTPMFDHDRPAFYHHLKGSEGAFRAVLNLRNLGFECEVMEVNSGMVWHTITEEMV
jgi:hypothetical protein